MAVRGMKDTCANAAYNGHLDCLKYAHENGCPWDERIHAQMQHTMGIQIALNMLMKMAAHGIRYTCSSAAYNGHLDCLKYAHENGCPWDKNMLLNAAYEDILDCLKYAHENGAPCHLGCKSITWCEKRCDTMLEKRLHHARAANETSFHRTCIYEN